MVVRFALKTNLALILHKHTTNTSQNVNLFRFYQQTFNRQSAGIVNSL